jgi:Arc/MetJ-type ribon-helix-helix transcriptional regulator
VTKPVTAHLPDHLTRFAEAEVAAGHFASVEDVIEAGVEALRKRQEPHEAIAAGDTSPDFEGNPLDKPRLPRRPPETKSLAQLFAESPLKGLELTFERDKDIGRPVRL